MKLKKSNVGSQKRIAVPHLSAQKIKAINSHFDLAGYVTKDELKQLLKDTHVDIPSGSNAIFFFIDGKEHVHGAKSELQRLGFDICKRPIHEKLSETPVHSTHHNRVLRKIQNIYELNQEELASLIGCSPRKVWDVLSNKGFFKSKSHQYVFNQIVRLTNDLLGLYTMDDLRIWIKSKNSNFFGKRPFDMIKKGHGDILLGWAYTQLMREYS